MNENPFLPVGGMIDILHLKKSFGRLHVLQGLDLHIDRGSVFAVIGPNGSGKSTLIKSILGLTRPDGGKIILDGCEVTTDGRQRERIGYMPQQAHFPGNLTAREVLAMLKDLRGPGAILDEELIASFVLEPELDKPLWTLSGGNRQKVSAVIAFLFTPDLIILDEPTAGLDPVASSTLKDKILKEKQRGKTFILTSHIMSEIEELADSVTFLLDGRARFTGRIAEIKQRTGQERLERAVAHIMTNAA